MDRLLASSGDSSACTKDISIHLEKISSKHNHLAKRLSGGAQVAGGTTWSAHEEQKEKAGAGLGLMLLRAAGD